MKTLKLTLCSLCLVMLTIGTFANKRLAQIREEVRYQDNCGDWWTLIVHYSDQGSAQANLNEKASHVATLIDRVSDQETC